MTIVLIIVCVLFCVGIVVAIVGHLGSAIPADRGWRARIQRHHLTRRRRGRDLRV